MCLSSIHITMLILSLLLVCAFFILSLYSAYIPVNNSFSCCHCHTLFSSLPKPVLTWMSLVCNLLFCCMLLSLVFWPLSLFFKLHSFDCHLFASSCVTLSLMDLHHLESSYCLLDLYHVSSCRVVSSVSYACPCFPNVCFIHLIFLVLKVQFFLWFSTSLLVSLVICVVWICCMCFVSWCGCVCASVLLCCIFSVLGLSVLPSMSMFCPSDNSCPRGSVFLVVSVFSSCVFGHL